MKRIHCSNPCKYRKLKKPKMSYIYEKTLVISIICDKCGSKHKKKIKKEESLKY